MGGCSREMEGDIRHGGELEDETGISVSRDEAEGGAGAGGLGLWWS